MRFASSRQCLLGALLALTSSTAFGGIRYVDANLASGTNDGSSWSNAFQGVIGLRLALTSSVAGDQIWVAQGRYKPTVTTTRLLSFELTSGVELYGGFAGGETLLSQRNVAMNVTMLDGDLNGDDALGVYSDNSFHVVYAGAVDATAVLDGFTVRGGNADGIHSNNQDEGGGILSYSSPTVRNCTFRDNRCSNHGAAGYLAWGTTTFLDTRFENNVGGSHGGALVLAGDTGSVIARCQFLSNTAASGGGVAILGSLHATLTNCVFWNNVSTGANAGGGALTITGQDPTIRDCTFVGNKSLVHVTGGIIGAGATPLINCIVYFNQGPSGAMGLADNVSGVIASYSCIQGGLAGTGNIASDPLLMNLAGGDVRLTNSSPCADAGSNTLVPPGTTTDLYGNARFADDAIVPDTGAGGVPIVDMGAHELANALYTFFCAADGSPATPCPCGNTGATGRGCANSGSLSQGGWLSASGTASPDTVVLTASDMLPTVSCVFLQGNAVNTNGVVFGDGIRCVAGSLKRLYIHSASGSAASAPVGADLSISARSAALGDTINAGEVRYYQVYYRDPDPTFCPNPPGNTWNVTAGVILQW